MSLKLVHQVDPADHGSSSIFFRWHPSSKAFAVACQNRSVLFYNSNCTVVRRNEIDEDIANIAWDKEGSILAISVKNISRVYIWHVYKNRTDTMESHLCGMEEVPKCFAWSSGSPALSIGNDIGFICVFDSTKGKRQMLADIHNKAITGLKFIPNNLLAACSEDNVLAIYKQNDLEQWQIESATKLAGTPSQLECSYLNHGENSPRLVVSVLLNKDSLFVAAADDLTECRVTKFPEFYGPVVSYSWLQDRAILVSFENGYVIMISTKPATWGAALKRFPEFESGLLGMVVDQCHRHCFSINEKSVKIRKLDKPDEVAPLTMIETLAGLDNIVITRDQKLLSVSDKQGAVWIYEIEVPPRPRAPNFNENPAQGKV
ncbi:unnamed protein product [Caenorhabditis sp. 36 PRJEB53466]|nr:unnamed protein product [Caenorhabditis sp. 36 PRJEB53466]